MTLFGFTSMNYEKANAGNTEKAACIESLTTKTKCVTPTQDTIPPHCFANIKGVFMLCYGGCNLQNFESCANAKLPCKVRLQANRGKTVGIWLLKSDGVYEWTSNKKLPPALQPKPGQCWRFYDTMDHGLIVVNYDRGMISISSCHPRMVD